MSHDSAHHRSSSTATLDIPSLPGFDQSVSFVREGYEFIRNRCTELGTDVFHLNVSKHR